MLNINEDMEYLNNDFAETIDGAMHGIEQPDFYMSSVDSPEPGDDDEDDSSEPAGTDDPPLDDEVVHSPVVPKSGNPNG